MIRASIEFGILTRITKQPTHWNVTWEFWHGRRAIHYSWHRQLDPPTQMTTMNLQAMAVPRSVSLSQYISHHLPHSFLSAVFLFLFLSFLKCAQCATAPELTREHFEVCDVGLRLNLFPFLFAYFFRFFLFFAAKLKVVFAFSPLFSSRIARRRRRRKKIENLKTQFSTINFNKISFSFHKNCTLHKLFPAVATNRLRWSDRKGKRSGKLLGKLFCSSDGGRRNFL